MPVVPLADAAPSAPAELLANKVGGYFPICESDSREIDVGVASLIEETTIERDAIVDRLGIMSADAVAADTGDQAEDRQGQRLGNRVITLPGQGQGPAGIVGRLGDPSHAEQRRRPPAQAPGQQRERPAVADGVADRGEVAQRPGRIG